MPCAVYHDADYPDADPDWSAWNTGQILIKPLNFGPHTITLKTGDVYDL